MRKLAVNSSGLGATASETAAQCVALGYASYLFNPACWGQSYADWQAQFYGPSTLAIAPPVAPAAPADLTALPDTTGQTAQNLSDQALLATQAANVADNPSTDACQRLSSSWPYPAVNLDCPTMFLWGAGVFLAVLLLPRLLK